ncbi:hypothetical protein IIU_02673 [Bacillus cereus VD133]|uniref:Glucanase n=1 Tax=Bacillus cereus VD133 TaxID=1053233 RepID=A0A9W5PSC3_BACCE|nr:glycosyl hydrolase family 8 [Bacillus cereus]EOO34184.1 hypothetical protein IIU_02673 [Bacillus cereus VD133]
MGIKDLFRNFMIKSRTELMMKPFPQHTKYTIGTIKPNYIDQKKLDQQVKEFYQMWKSKYLIKSSMKPNQYYINSNIEGMIEPKNTVSISESHGHGMLLMVIMANTDDFSEKIYFDGLYRFYKDHPSNNNHLLMGWKQIKDKNGNIVNYESSTDNPDSATDGDMDIAYSLLLAHYQWGSDGEINYLNEAKRMIKAIMLSDVNSIDLFLKLGDWVPNDNSKYGRGTRPSDFMIDHLKAFQKETSDPRWIRVIDKTYIITNQIYNLYTGLLPDFAEKQNGHFKPVKGVYLESEYDGYYFTNACRTPWRLSLDYLLTGDNRALTLLNKLNSWIKRKTNNDPNKIKSGYYLDGRDLPNSSENHLEFISPFAVSAMVNDNNQEWLNMLWEKMISIDFNKSRYYGNSIKLLCMVVISNNWWFPE